MSERLPVWKNTLSIWKRIARSKFFRRVRRFVPFAGGILLSVTLLQKHSVDDSVKEIADKTEKRRQWVTEVRGEDQVMLELRAAIRAVALKVGAERPNNPFGPKAPDYDFISLSLDKMMKMNNEYAAFMTSMYIRSPKAYALNNQANEDMKKVQAMLESIARNPRLFDDATILSLRHMLANIDASLFGVKNQMLAELDGRTERLRIFNERMRYFFEAMAVIGLSLTWVGKEPPEVEVDD